MCIKDTQVLDDRVNYDQPYGWIIIEHNFQSGIVCFEIKAFFMALFIFKSVEIAYII